TPPFVPASGFDDREVYLETGATDCASSLCMVYALKGDPSPGCVSTIFQNCDPMKDRYCKPPKVCADPEEVRNRIYCSYRCAAVGASAAPCPGGFSCREVMPQGGGVFAGSYCVKDGTFEPP